MSDKKIVRPSASRGVLSEVEHETMYFTVTQAGFKKPPTKYGIGRSVLGLETVKTDINTFPGILYLFSMESPVMMPLMMAGFRSGNPSLSTLGRLVDVARKERPRIGEEVTAVANRFVVSGKKDTQVALDLGDSVSTVLANDRGILVEPLKAGRHTVAALGSASSRYVTVATCVDAEAAHALNDSLNAKQLPQVSLAAVRPYQIIAN